MFGVELPSAGSWGLLSLRMLVHAELIVRELVMLYAFPFRCGRRCGCRSSGEVSVYSMVRDERGEVGVVDRGRCLAGESDTPHRCLRRGTRSSGGFARRPAEQR